MKIFLVQSYCRWSSGIDFPAQYSTKNNVFKVTQARTVADMLDLCLLTINDWRYRKVQYFIRKSSQWPSIIQHLIPVLIYHIPVYLYVSVQYCELLKCEHVEIYVCLLCECVTWDPPSKDFLIWVTYLLCPPSYNSVHFIHCNRLMGVGGQR